MLSLVAMTVIAFSSAHSEQCWTMVCRIKRDNFVTWLYNLNITSSKKLLLGDFNFIKYAENRNKLGADMNDIFLFNDIINHLGLLELPLKGRAFTWSNMQKTTSS
jgi:hypothetical protein